MADVGSGADRCRSRPDADYLDALFTQATIGLGFLGPDLRYRRVNAWLAAINGTSPDGHVGRRPAEVLGELGREVESICRQVQQTGQPVVELEVTGRLSSDPILRSWTTSYYPVPGATGDPPGIGAVIVETTRLRQLSQREHEARRDAEQARYRAEWLAAAEQSLATSMDVDEVAGTVVRSAVGALADWCALQLVTPSGGLRLVAARHRDPGHDHWAEQVSTDWTAGPGAGLVEVVLETSTPALHHDLSVTGDPDREEALAALRKAGVGGLLVAPLLARRQVVGVLHLGSSEPLSKEIAELAVSFAGRAGLSIDNARLLAEQRQVARQLQRTLVPAGLPTVPDVDIAGRYRPAGREVEAGGDFYDVFPAADGSWGFAVGDVVGKGARAASRTAVARYTLRGAAASGMSPAGDLAVVNRVFRDHADEGDFCSAVTGRLSRRGPDVSVVLASAGHPPALVRRVSGALESAPAGGILLGVGPDVPFRDHHLLLAAGDVLLLYTDGALELRGPEPYRGEELLRQTFARLGDRSAEEVVEGLERELVLASGGTLRDDLALLAIRADPR